MDDPIITMEIRHTTHQPGIGATNYFGTVKCLASEIRRIVIFATPKLVSAVHVKGDGDGYLLRDSEDVERVIAEWVAWKESGDG